MNPAEPSLVAGDHMDRSLADFVRSCEVHLAEEQAKPNPDNALIALLCDAVRLAREQKPRLLDAKDQDHRDERGELQNVPSVQAAAAQVDLALHGLPSEKIAPPVSGEGTGTPSRLQNLARELKEQCSVGCLYCTVTVEIDDVEHHEADCIVTQLEAIAAAVDATLAAKDAAYASLEHVHQQAHTALAAAESTLADLRRLGEWQPIETAPQNESVLIVVGGEVDIATFHTFAKGDDKGDGKVGWWASDYDYQSSEIQPERWMLLPDARQLEEARRG